MTSRLKIEVIIKISRGVTKVVREIIFKNVRVYKT